MCAEKLTGVTGAVDGVSVMLIDDGLDETFLPLIPSSLHGRFRAKGTTALGAVTPCGDGEYDAVGICLSPVEDGWIEIDWLWAAGEEYVKNAAAGMVNVLIGAAVMDDEVVGITASYPAKRGAEFSEIFESRGFVLSDSTLDGYRLKLSDLADSAFFSKAPKGVELVKPLSEISASMRDAFSKATGALDESVGIEAPIEWDSYDPGVSMLYEKDGAIHGVTLVRKDGEGLELAWAYAQAGAPSAFAASLYASAKAASENLPADTNVSVIALNDVSKGLVEKLIPGAAPIKVKEAELLLV
jgi:hypothetical protein